MAGRFLNEFSTRFDRNKWSDQPEVDVAIEAVIYTARLAHGALVLLVIYAKSARENIPAQVLRKIAEEMGHATS